MAYRRRKGVGLSAFDSSLTSSYASHGAALRDTQNSSLATQLSVLQDLLHTIALKYSDEIKSNPTYQREFARMCTAVGVDPLAGSNNAGKKKGKGWWGQVFGGNDESFYSAVAVKVVEICNLSRGENGGLLGVTECAERVRKGRTIGGGMEVDE
jgi:ESCRT-II complex subunit VPS22